MADFLCNTYSFVLEPLTKDDTNCAETQDFTQAPQLKRIHFLLLRLCEVYGLASMEKFLSDHGTVDLQFPPTSSRTNCCLPEGIQFEPCFQCLVHFVLYLVFHVHFLCDSVSKVGRFFHSVQVPSVWKLDHIATVHRCIATLVPIQT